MKRATTRIAVDDVAAHNQRMWDRLSAAGIPYTRPQGTPPKTDRAKRRFLDPNGRLAGLPIKGRRVLALAGGGGWHPVLFAELGAETTVLDISARQLKTVRDLARSRDVKVRRLQGDMRDLSAFADGSFDIVWHSHSLVFVPDADRVIAEVGRVLAVDGVYRASTMHPVTMRMYGTWTGTGWGFRQSYFEDAAVPYEDANWVFKDVTVEAPTVEYGHRISDLINACAAAGLVIDGFWETTPGEISTALPVRALSRERLVAERDAPEPGSDDALEHYLPAFIELRARKVSLRSGSGSPSRTATRSPRASASRQADSRTTPRRRPAR